MMNPVPFEPMTWREIAEEISRKEGKERSITSQGCCDLNKRMIRRLREKLENDPLVQEWLEAHPTKTMDELNR